MEQVAIMVKANAVRISIESILLMSGMWEIRKAYGSIEEGSVIFNMNDSVNFGMRGGVS